MQKKIITSVSLPNAAAKYWREHRANIMQFAERYLRLQMRNPVRRELARQYNRTGDAFEIVTTRFSTAEYDTLHYVAAALRVSVSSLIFGLIKLWLKPSRRAIQRFFSINYSYSAPKWDPEAGILEEILTFWRHNGNNATVPLADNLSSTP
ncbi:MAG: hypothetical protein JSR44_10695 [Spirochaetes bacterium]|nr:hypothetical protein [Spirochaetota bacterium]